jgi:putative ABC transport system permease protein
MLARGERFVRELEEEMRLHREMKEQQLRKAGVSREEARYAASKAFGNDAVLRERSGEAWGWRWLKDFVRDLRFGGRMLGKNPSFTMVAVVTMALGIGANTAIFTVVKAVLLNGLPYRAPERLVALAAKDSESTRPKTVSYLGVMDWKERSQSLSSIALYRAWNPTLSGSGRPEVLQGARVTHEFFETLGVQLAMGRGFSPEEDRPNQAGVVIVSYGFWRTRFAGKTEGVGSTMVLNQRSYQVIGVLPESFRSEIFSDEGRSTQVWAPLGYDAALPAACRSCQHLRSVGRLAEGVTVEQARAELNGIAAQMARQYPNDYPPSLGVVVTSLTERVVGEIRTALWLLMGATGLVLLVACANVANLLLARSAARQHEMALRAALGASRMRLARQLLTESLILSVLGGACGAALAWRAAGALALWAPSNLPRLTEVRVDGGVLLFAVGAALTTGMVAGLLPMLKGARAAGREAIQESTRSTGNAQQGRVRAGLVVAEVALTFALTVSAGLLVKSLVRVLAVNPGFDTQSLYTANLALIGPKYEKDADVLAVENEALRRIRALPEVAEAAYVSTLPLGGSFDQRGFHVQDRPLASSTEAPSVEAYFVTPEYLRTMKIPLLEGRDFTERDAEVAGHAPVAIISQATARELFPGSNPLGKRIQLGARSEKKPWAAIVGIAGDVRQYGLDSEMNAAAYLLSTQDPISYPVLLVRTRAARQTLTAQIEEQVAELDKTIPVYGATTMEDLMATSTTQRRFVAGLLGGFGVLALVLAGIGVFGVTAYEVAQRRNEIGIRMAMGADRQSVVRMVVTRSLRQVGAGLLIGFPLAIGAGIAASHQLFGVRSYDPGTLGGAALLLGLAALVAAVAPALRAASTDPMQALRTE